MPGKLQELETAKISSNTVCVPHLILTKKLKPSYLAAPSVLSVSFLDFSARESLMSFNSWLSLSTSSSPIPPSPDSPLAPSKDCSDKKEALYLTVIIFNGHFIWWYCYFTRSSAPPDSRAACSTKAKEEHSFLCYFKTLSIGPAWEFKPQNSRYFFSKSVKKSVKCGVRVLRLRSISLQSRSLFSASFQTFCLTAHAYSNTQKYGLFCSLRWTLLGHQYLCHPYKVIFFPRDFNLQNTFFSSSFSSISRLHWSEALWACLRLASLEASRTEQWERSLTTRRNTLQRKNHQSFSKIR